MSTHSRFLRPTMYLPAALLPVLTACGDRPAADTADANTSTTLPTPVSIAPVSAQPTASPVVATGTFGSRDEIPLAFKIGGVIERVTVDEGATVRRGQVLAALDLREIDAAVTKAQVGVDKAQRDHARITRLAADSVATLAQLQDATSALDAARADLATARVNREYSIVTAPEDGVVLHRFGTPGSTVGPGQPVLTLGGSKRGRVMRAGLTDRDALRVRVGDKATVRFDAISDRSFTGSVVLLGRAADARTGTFAVEVALSGSDALPSGLVGQITIAVAGTSLAASVPVDALLEADRDSATVFTVADTTSQGAHIARAQRVRVSQLNGAYAAVTGLEDGALVITRGAPYVTDGARVRVVNDATLDSTLRAASTAASTAASATAPQAPTRDKAGTQP